MRYVNLVIDNKANNNDRYYTYASSDDNIAIGQKVYVSFANNKKAMPAYVFQKFEEKPEALKDVKIKEIDSIDEEICLTEEIISSCQFLKRRFLCRYIDAVNLFTPVGAALKSGKERDPIKDNLGDYDEVHKLTKEQTLALEIIEGAIQREEPKTFLLHGITGSGKTEVYIRSVEKQIEKGKTAIVLVPEIALTKQIIDRFIGCFGAEKIAIMHSKLSQGERYDQWKKIRDGRVNIVIGARSAIFAPLENIGIIIIDEEHEATYKSDKTPKYTTHDIAHWRCKEHNAILLLGSATPSIISSYRADRGIYEKIELRERYNKVKLPEVEIVDLRQELKSGNRTVISRRLFDLIKENLEAKKQIILFLNRRGHSTFVSCRECGYVVHCKECRITMTYHKGAAVLKCHYCGKREKIPSICPECGSDKIRYFGAGTEKVQEQIEKLFPEAKIGRLDIDTIKKKGSLEEVLSAFGKNETKILIGTQLVAKGLDYENVGLVGIISADTALNIPDFRASERAFQLIVQASGRSGRGKDRGKVLIQTYNPEHYAIETAAAQDYGKFYETEIKLREFSMYPPFSDLLQIT
ncbi:MAG: replication restart helicase PriA, partial [Anaerovoracaceae bacterium]